MKETKAERYAYWDPIILVSYTVTLNAAETGRRLGWSSTFVHGRLHAMGLPTLTHGKKAKHGGPRNPESAALTARIVSLSEDDMLTPKQIGRVVGRSPGAVRDRLRSVGKGRSKDICQRGHEFTPGNTLHLAHGRQCRTCKRMMAREWARQQRRAKQTRR